MPLVGYTRKANVGTHFRAARKIYLRNGKVGPDGKNYLFRLHAACDLYRPEHEPIYAVANGKVIRDPFHYVRGTYAFDVKHDGGFVVRYAEITSRKAPGIKKGEPVFRDQEVGYVGRLSTRVRPAMIHFELYRGNLTGLLTREHYKRGFRRRNDLLDPTDYLLDWQRKFFGDEAFDIWAEEHL